MVNGNYVLYGDRPSSDTETIDDHVHTRTTERKNRRKSNRTANELQRTLNMAQLDNETDSVKYEKNIKEPRLLRYVSTADVKENFVNEKFETYDLKPTEERPRRYSFQKKPKNPADGSVNYAYSRSSSSCSSPVINLPKIPEHEEQYGTYRVRSVPRPTVGTNISYESKMDNYFTKSNDGKIFTTKGTHPDSLYRVPASSSVGGDTMARVLRVLRWPVALVATCIALAVLVYFLIPVREDHGLIAVNKTYWEPVAVGASYGGREQKHNPKPDILPHPHDTKTPEIDFYDAENEKVVFSSILDSTNETNHRKLPIQPVFPIHITPEVQYGNEKADSEKLRTAKTFKKVSVFPQDSTVKPHITQKPEKPLAVYFSEGNAETTTTSETITRAETINEFTNYGGDKPTTQIIEEVSKSYGTINKDPSTKPFNVKQYLVTEPKIPQQVQKFYSQQPLNVNVNFSSGHSNLFGISIEDAETMKATTQNSLYSTRVSPTLPTWRDGDDTTTKKYSVNVNYEGKSLKLNELHQVSENNQSSPLCRGVLPYDLASSPATISGVKVTSLLPQIEYLVGTNCSDRVKHFMCALMEPECSPPPYAPKMPCYNLCKAIVLSCEGSIPLKLDPAFNCAQYSQTNCVGARTPCYPEEFECGDQSCVSKDWICDGTQDCPGGEDETSCDVCDKNKFRCRSGTCILKRWLCDGYADCPGGEDEIDGCDHHVAGDLGDEAAGSAPAPAVRRPNRLPAASRMRELNKSGEPDSSKELLITSDSNNAFKRNFTRRPSPSRLSPYSRLTVTQSEPSSESISSRKFEPRQKPEEVKLAQKPENTESLEEINIGVLGFLEDIKKTNEELPLKNTEQKPRSRMRSSSTAATLTRLDKSINKLEKVINGAALLQKAAAEEESDYTEPNGTTIEMEEHMTRRPKIRKDSSISSHVSPCPSGELRCVDGRCITLAQLCDGTIDCTDHADEDNCYT
ncbi:Uncharacterized protein OBRU01_10394 [Operophtera brumata]|uniref:FZ domain-containing protein n=1 Tax=Operophtera brumata TaxID=104452 RepID=A0A0L7LDM0_OPEBR|nr:Uncharacterized protein OBRU01_10394 [Operophtera brumata]